MLLLAMMVVLGSADWPTVNNKATGETSVGLACDELSGRARGLGVCSSLLSLPSTTLDAVLSELQGLATVSAGAQSRLRVLANFICKHCSRHTLLPLFMTIDTVAHNNHSIPRARLFCVGVFVCAHYRSAHATHGEHSACLVMQAHMMLLLLIPSRHSSAQLSAAHNQQLVS